MKHSADQLYRNEGYKYNNSYLGPIMTASLTHHACYLSYDMLSKVPTHGRTIERLQGNGAVINRWKVLKMLQSHDHRSQSGF